MYWSVDERLALLGLWSVCGFGAKQLKALQAKRVLGDIARLPCKAWLPQLDLPPMLAESFLPDVSLQLMGEQVLEKAQKAHMQVLFYGEAGFPPGLEVLGDMPPMLFAWGEVSPVEAPKVAMVGTRQVEAAFVPTARHFARRVAQAGMQVVSGAAEGVDQACLEAAMEASGRAWAFVGCGLDKLAFAQRAFWDKCMSQGGTYFSEYPPGVRADKFTYPRRNRLISAASNAVLVLRAPRKSGSLYTAQAALEQGRPLWVLPGELETLNAQGCLHLLKHPKARLATAPEDIVLSLGGRACPPKEEEMQAKPAPASLGGRACSPPQSTKACAPAAAALSQEEASGLSPAALLLWELLQTPASLEDLLAASRMDSADLAQALCELELLGRVEQKPGKRYERTQA